MQRPAVIVVMLGWLGEARALEPPQDRVEAVQPRAWLKQDSVALSTFGAWAFNDPFVTRGGGGLRALWWPKPLLGVSVEGAASAQRPSDAARTARRELRARQREAASGWSALAGAELSVADGKVVFGSRIAPFELLLRSSLGLCGTTEGLHGGATTALAAATGARWFLRPSWAIETTLAWRTATIERMVDGRPMAARDTTVALELAADWRWGGTR